MSEKIITKTISLREFKSQSIMLFMLIFVTFFSANYYLDLQRGHIANNYSEISAVESIKERVISIRDVFPLYLNSIVEDSTVNSEAPWPDVAKKISMLHNASNKNIKNIYAVWDGLQVLWVSASEKQYRLVKATQDIQNRKLDMLQLVDRLNNDDVINAVEHMYLQFDIQNMKKIEYVSNNNVELPVFDKEGINPSDLSMWNYFVQSVDDLDKYRKDRTNTIMYIKNHSSIVFSDMVNHLDSIRITMLNDNVLIKSKIRYISFGVFFIVVVMLSALFIKVFRTLKVHEVDLTNFEREKNILSRRMALVQEREKEKTNFMAVLSYEARISLESILGLTKIAKRSCQTRDQDTKLGQVVQSATELHRLLDDVLIFVDLELNSVVLNEDVVHLEKILEFVFDKMTKKAKSKSILFEYSIDPGVSKYVMGDHRYIIKSLFYLVNNSMKATEEGHVIVRVEEAGQTGYESEMQRISFTIEDSGATLISEKSDDLFSPFSGIDSNPLRKSSGEGLRLYTAKRLIELMGGGVSVQGNQGQGIRLDYYINLAVADSMAIDQYLADKKRTSKEEENKFVEASSLKIMVVEDNETNANLLTWMLEDYEHEVMIAKNGIECLNLLESHDFDIIFMDQHMPEMNGIEATKMIRERNDHYAHIPIIGCTADAFQDTRDQLLACGQNDVVNKPISDETIGKVLKNFASGQYVQTQEVNRSDSDEKG